ncbi:MAG: hypothetical protein OEV00_05155 [Acidobacteriota bacterium]|nr:hypothetical protein [Acidobacteriota bacterium]MDH3784703.1 hypothetical protein [Acidobacteriota bacterium]
MSHRRFRIIYVTVCASIVVALSFSGALAYVDQDDVILDPTGGKHRIVASDAQGREGFGRSGTLRDDLLTEKYYMCISNDAGSERVRSVFIVTDRWNTSPRVLTLHEEDEYVRFYLNGVKIDNDCDHRLAEGDCKNAGIPDEFDGEIESEKIHWITEDGELGSGLDHTVVLLVLTEDRMERPCP